MPFLTSRAAILAKLETVEGANPVPGATDAIVTIGTPVVTFNPDEVKRDIVSPQFSEWGFVVGITTAQIQFTTEFKGPARSVTSASPVREDPLFRACGMGPSYSLNATSVPYNFYTASATASQSATVALYAHIDGILNIFTGCRGSFQIMLEDGQFPKIQWTFMGLYAALGSSVTSGGIQDAALPTPSYDALTVVPPPFMGANFALSGGYSAICQALNINVNNQVQSRPSFIGSRGLAGILITDREVTGTVNPEAVPRATHDFFYAHQQALTGALTASIGTSGTLWTTTQVDMPKVQYRIPKWGDRNGIRTFDIDILAVRNSSGGDDEMVLTYKQ